MLHLWFDKQPWFAAKRFGYGAGLPTAWQGWPLIALYLSVLGGIGRLAAMPQAMPRAGAFALLSIATAAFVLVVRRRTQGGWRWRWGKDPR